MSFIKGFQTEVKIVLVVVVFAVVIGGGVLIYVSAARTETGYTFPLDSKSEAESYSLSLQIVEEVLGAPLSEEYGSYDLYEWRSEVRRFPDSENEWIVEWRKGEDCNNYGCYLRFDRDGVITLPFQCYGISTCK